MSALGPLQTRVAYCCDLLSSSRSRSSSDTKRSARCHAFAAEREELPEHDALGCCIDGSSLRQLHERAHLMKAADDQDPRA